jgi:predicted MFS family arabinose efflux permease
MLSSLGRSYRDAFAGLPRDVWVLATVLFVNRVGMMVLPFLTLFLVQERGFDVAEAGRITSLYGLGAVAGVTAGGWLTDRCGSRRVQLASLLFNGAFLLVTWLVRPPWAIGGAVIATSFAAEIFRPANGAAISRAAPPAVRARSFSLMSQAVCVGLTIGLPVAGALAERDYDWLFWIDAGTAFAAAAVLWAFGPREPEPDHDGARRAARARSPWSDRDFALALGLLCATATVLFQFFGALPVFLKRDLSFEEGAVGWLLAFNTVLTALFGMQVIRRVERGRPLAWLALSAVLIGLGYGVNALARGAPLAILSVLVWTAGEMLLFPLSAAYASSRAPNGAVGRYMSAYGLSFAVPLALAPFLGTAVYDRWGATAVWVGCAGLGSAAGVAFLLLGRRGEEGRADPSV